MPNDIWGYETTADSDRQVVTTTNVGTKNYMDSISIINGYDGADYLPVTITTVGSKNYLDTNSITLGWDGSATQKIDATQVGTEWFLHGWNLLQGYNGTNWQPVGLDTVTRAVNFINYEHHEVHLGSHYAIRSYEALAKNGTKDFLFITPDTTKWQHMVITIAHADSVILVSLYEAATVSDNGTIQTANNRNRNSANTATLNIYEDPTVTTTGTLLFDSWLGAGKNIPGGETRDSQEIILKQNTIYLFRIVEQNVDATVINWVFDWYEHTSKDV